MSDETSTTTAEENKASTRKPRKPKADAPANSDASEKVKVKITKFGDGKVCSGKHIDGVGDEVLDAGEIIEVDRATAQALEATGVAEIQ